MILSRRAGGFTLAKFSLFASGLILVSLGAEASSTGRTVDAQDISILKANGTHAVVRLLPVHESVGHLNEVRQRLIDAQRRYAPLALPASYQIAKEKLPVVRDQGQRGSCAYFATVGLTETYYLRRPTHDRLDLSEECLVDVRNWMFDQDSKYAGDDKPRQRPDPDGDLPNSIIRTIERNGIPLEAKYHQADCRYKWSGKALDLAKYNDIFASGQSVPFAKGLTYDQNVKPTIEDVKALIAADIPVEVGILVYQEYFSDDAWRYRPYSDNDRTLAGGHAVILTGYRKSGSSTIFTFKNSWGEGWGSSGYGTMDDKLLVHSWGYDKDLDFIVSLHD